MPPQSFEKWLAGLLREPEAEINHLLKDETAVRFLIAWSLFETACFGGFMKSNQIESFAQRAASNPAFDVGALRKALSHFHARYQEKTPYKNLMHEATCARFDSLLKKPIETMTPDERVFFVAYVVYRFRNNIFHGNKGVHSWLEYRPQIQLCIGVMQCFVSHFTVGVELKAA